MASSGDAVRLTPEEMAKRIPDAARRLSRVSFTAYGYEFHDDKNRRSLQLQEFVFRAYNAKVD